MRGQAALALDRNAIKIPLEDEVDHPGHRVRTVNCRVAAGDDVDAFEQIDRDGVDVNQVVTRNRGDMAAAIDQHQGPRCAEAAQIEDVEAGGADEPSRVARAEGRAQRRQVIQRIAQRNVAAVGQFTRGDRGQRNRRAERWAGKVRTGNNDVTSFILVAHAVVVAVSALFSRIGRSSSSLRRSRGGAGQADQSGG